MLALETHAFNETSTDLGALGVQSDADRSAEQRVLQEVGSLAHVLDCSSVVLE